MKLVNNSQNTFLAKGRIKSNIDESLFTEKEPKNTIEGLLFFLPPNMEDNLRVRTDTFWKLNGTATLNRKQKIPFPIKFESFSDALKVSADNIFGKYTQRIIIAPNGKFFNILSGIPLIEGTQYNTQAWRRYIQELLTIVPLPIPDEPSQSVPGVQVNLNNNNDFVPDGNNLIPSTAARNFRNLPTTSNLGQFIEDSLNRSAVEDDGIADVSFAPRTPTKRPNDVFKFEPTIQRDETYFDHVFELGLPFNKEQQEKFITPIGSSFVNVEPVYNFFVRNYEQQISDSIVTEGLLPNLYSFVTELRQENTDEKNTLFKQHITLNGTLDGVFVDILNSRGEKIGEKDTSQYFEKYARNVKKFVTEEPTVSQQLADRFKTQIVSLSDVDFFNDFNSRSQSFPMYFDVQFTTDQSTEFAQLLEDSKLSTVLIKDILDDNVPVQNLNSACIETDASLTNTRTLKQLSEVKYKETRRWDIAAWAEELSKRPVESFEPLVNGTILGGYEDEVKLAQSSQYDLHKNLYVVVFINKLKDLINRRIRTYKSMIEGTLAPSETVFYRIEKTNTETGEVLQNFWLPNSNEIEVFRFIDTQVKYNKKYTYKIYAYQFVIGNKYSYDLVDIKDKSAEVQVEFEPSVQLIETLFHEFTGRIMDSPPMSPDVTVIPYKAINNQILFNFQNQTGQLELKPIIIESTDQDIIDELRESQMKEEDEFLTYRADESAHAYEIFRADKLPRTWRDFENRRVALVHTDVNPVSPQKASAASFIDNVLPNKKYFYTFRTIDNHGHISNPTAIYQIILFDNDGAVYPEVKIVDFDKQEKQKTTVKTGKRFVRIAPALNQIIVNELNSGLIENGERVNSVLGKKNISLGVADEALWKKRFKVRLTSKKTGRKIDINVSFKNLFREDV